MYLTKCRRLLMLGVWALAAALVSAQITFSRDWTGGKRAAPHLPVDCEQFARLCRHFVHELHHQSPELIRPRTDHEDPSLVYDDDN